MYVDEDDFFERERVCSEGYGCSPARRNAGQILQFGWRLKLECAAKPTAFPNSLTVCFCSSVRVHQSCDLAVSARGPDMLRVGVSYGTCGFASEIAFYNACLKAPSFQRALKSKILSKHSVIFYSFTLL